MKTKTKQDYQGNKIVLMNNKLYFYNNDQLFKITEHLSYESALQEFNNITNSHRGCGVNKWRKQASATVYYNQLIIRL
jgi:hypothetical protein